MARGKLKFDVLESCPATLSSVCGVRVGLFKRHRFMGRSVGEHYRRVFGLVPGLLIRW